MGEKNYISLLQNYLLKLKEQVTYSFVAEGKGEHQLFKCQVNAANKVAIGKGRSKKIAKHDAARIMYELFHKEQEEATTLETLQESNVNPIDALNKLCQEHDITQLKFQYEKTSEFNHAAVHKVYCSIPGLTVDSQSFSKTKAKERAASKMISKLNDLNKNAIIAMKDGLKREQLNEAKSINICDNLQEQLLTEMENVIKSSESLNNLKKRDISHIDNVRDPETLFRKILKEMGYEHDIHFIFVIGYGFMCNLNIKKLNYTYDSYDKDRLIARKIAFKNGLKFLFSL